MSAIRAPVAPAPFSGSYAPDDVLFLLKPVILQPLDVATKERAIQSGTHYSEMLSPETIPDQSYLDLFDAALTRNGARLGTDIASLAAALVTRTTPGREIVLASLARAGTPIGVLLVRALRRLGVRATHYSLSIIRGRGIDANALAYIAARHDAADTVFVDGWTGKGAIAAELAASLADRPFGFAPYLAVVADPAGRADLAATDDDYLIASGLLNAIVSGLVSRSILNAALVSASDFHACVHYRQFALADRSRSFVDTIDTHAAAARPRVLAGDVAAQARAAHDCETMVATLMDITGVRDRNRIKPGIAEATRALLRRVPDRLFVRDAGDPDVAHLVHLAAAMRLTIDDLPGASRYRAVAVIRTLGEDQ